MYKGIIFDLDGTLLNTLDTLAYYANTTLESFGLAPYPTNEYKMMVGGGAKNLIHRMLCGRDRDDLFDRVYPAYVARYDSDPTYLTSIYDGIEELLAHVRAQGMKTAVLSNKPHSATVPIIQAFLKMDLCFGAREGVPIKPDPTAALEIAEMMDCRPEECLYLGDSGVDMKTGKAAGFYTVGVLWGFRDRAELAENGADLLITHPRELLPLCSRAVPQ